MTTKIKNAILKIEVGFLKPDKNTTEKFEGDLLYGKSYKSSP
jgi:hypothetical protein